MGIMTITAFCRCTCFAGRPPRRAGELPAAEQRRSGAARVGDSGIVGEAVAAGVAGRREGGLSGHRLSRGQPVLPLAGSGVV